MLKIIRKRGSEIKEAKHLSVVVVGFLCSEALGKTRARLDHQPDQYIWALWWLLGETLRRVWCGLVRAETSSKIA